jgi:hypothetical protein
VLYSELALPIAGDIAMKTVPQRSARHAAALSALATAAAAMVFTAPLAVQAQAEKPPLKGTPRPPSNPSPMSGIPSGTDTGTPGSSNSVPLGLSTTPANDAERAAMKKETAAARAAARPRARAASAPPAAASAPAGGAASAAAARPGGRTP